MLHATRRQRLRLRTACSSCNLTTKSLLYAARGNIPALLCVSPLILMAIFQPFYCLGNLAAHIRAEGNISALLCMGNLAAHIRPEGNISALLCMGNLAAQIRSEGSISALPPKWQCRGAAHF